MTPKVRAIILGNLGKRVKEMKETPGAGGYGFIPIMWSMMVGKGQVICKICLGEIPEGVNYYSKHLATYFHIHCFDERRY